MGNTELAAEPRRESLLSLIGIRPIWLVLLAGLLVRLWLANAVEGVPADLRLYVTWGNEIANDGPFHFYDTWKDYLPGYLYVLGGIALLAKWFSFNEQTHWYVIKVASILADLGSAYVLYLFLAPKPERIRLLAAAFYLCLPSVLIVSAAWGQSDSFLALPLFLSVYFISRGRPVASAVSFTIAFMVKMLAIAAFPLFVIWILRDYKPKVWLQCAAASGLLAFAIVWPFFPDHPWDFFDQAYKSTSNFTFAALFTYNLWGAFGWFRQDSIEVFGVSWHTWGEIFTVTGEALVALAFYRARSPGAYALGVAMAMLTSFAFLSRMHERYIFAAFLPFLAACFFYNRISLWVSFLVLSAIEFCGIFVGFYVLAEKREPWWVYSPRLWEWLNRYPHWWSKHEWPGTPQEFFLSMILVAMVIALVIYSNLLGFRFRFKGGFRVERVPIDPPS
jgi:dolichyl-phosphate-mannose-protein mannosyltransferase